MPDLAEFEAVGCHYRTIRTPPRTTLIGAGFMRKTNPRYAEPEPARGSFKHFSASVVLRGRGVYSLDDGSEIPLQEGSLFFRIPDVPHATRMDISSDFLEFFVAFALGVEGRWADRPDLQGSLGVMATQLLMLDARMPVRQITVDAHLLARCHRFVMRLKNNLRLELASLDALRLMIDMIMLDPPAVHTDPLIDEVCIVLQRNAANRTPLPKLCSSFPLSYMRLRARFQEHMGQSMGQYQLAYRMEMAAQLLRQKISVKDVAYRLGYSDSFAFSKQFRQQVGTVPSRFR
jgi:AraC-like DNA-binding protein